MKVYESDISALVRDFLQFRGWRAIRMQRTVIPGSFQTAEPGMPDFLFVRYLKDGAGLLLWIELKRPGDRRTCRCVANLGSRRRCTVCDQKNWREREHKLGARVWRVDNAESFAAEYDRHYGWLHRGENAQGQLELAVQG